MKYIRIPARAIAESVDPIESIVILPQQNGRMIVSTSSSAEQFERILTPQELDAVMALIEPAVTQKYANAVVEDIHESNDDQIRK